MMKLSILLFFLILYSSILGQDINHLYTPYGFQLPSLRSSEYVTSFYGSNFLDINTKYFKYLWDINEIKKNEKLAGTFQGIFAVTDYLLFSFNIKYYPEQNSRSFEHNESSRSYNYNCKLKSYIAPEALLVFHPFNNLEVYGKYFKDSYDYNYNYYKYLDPSIFPYKINYNHNIIDIGITYSGNLFKILEPDLQANHMTEPYGFQTPFLKANDFTISLSYTKSLYDSTLNNNVLYEKLKYEKDLYSINFQNVYAITNNILFKGTFNYFPDQISHKFYYEEGHMKSHTSINYGLFLHFINRLEIFGSYYSNVYNVSTKVDEIYRFAYPMDIEYEKKNYIMGINYLGSLFNDIKKDITNWYKPSGFLFPFLKQGDYIISLSFISNTNYVKHNALASFLDQQLKNNKIFGNLSAISAITDYLLLKFNLSYIPNQEIYNLEYVFENTEFKSSEVKAYIAPNLNLVYRPKSNIEIFISYYLNQFDEALFKNNDPVLTGPYKTNHNVQNFTIGINYFNNL
jgi:hypothetical protein